MSGTSPIQHCVFPMLTEENMQAVGRALAEFLAVQSQPITVFLSGDLGAGKTTLARACIHACYAGHTPLPQVVSPSFTLMQHYDTPQGDVTHIDLYRLAHPQEALALGLYELAESSTLIIEWPQHGVGSIPDADIALEIIWVDAEHRQLTISANFPLDVTPLLSSLHTLL